MSTKNINAWDWDVRVRERNIARGVLTDKDVEKMTGGLPDLASVTENVSLAQPAMAAAPGAGDADDDDDEEEEEAES